jgi:hypothetical protein
VPLLMKVHAVTQLADLPQEELAELIDPTCDFSAFVALRHDIDRNAAERLIEDWLSRYRPRPMARLVTRSGEQRGNGAADYDICA